MKKILISLLAGAVMTTAFALSAMAAGDTTEGADNAVAKIGDQYYTTVDKAMADAVDKADETVIIEVLKDINNIPEPTRAGLHFKAADGVKVTYRVNPPRSKKIDGTVTYEGFDFTTYDSGNGLFAAFAGGHELEGLEVVFVDCQFGGQKSIGFSWGVSSNMEKLTIDNCTIAAEDASQYFILGYIDAVEIKNCDFSKHKAGNSIVQISTTSNNVVITNCNFGTGYINYGANVGADGKVLKVTGCTFEGDKAINVHRDTTNNGTKFEEIAILNNTLGEDTTVMVFPVDAKEYLDENADSILFAGNVDVKDNAVTNLTDDYAPAPPAAKIGNEYYATIKEALEATAGEDTVTVVLSAGEYSIADFTLASGVRNYPYANNVNIVADGDVTVKLDSETKCYQNGVAYQYFVGGSWYVCGESFTFEGIDFVFEDTNTADKYTMAEIQTYGSKLVSYKDCTFDNVSVSPWGDNQAGKFEECVIEDCTFENISARSAIHQSKALELTVDECTFTDVVSGIHISADELDSLTVTDNTFTGLADDSAAIYFGNESWNGVWVGDYSEAVITVTGNTANGALVRNSNESLTMTHINALSDETANTFDVAFTENSVDFVVFIGETGFTTVKAAVEYANANNISEIELLGDSVEDETVVITKDITIDGNGYTISGKSFAQVATKDDEAVTPVIVDGATVVFENITLVGGSTANNYEYQQLGSWGIAGDALRVINKANVTVNGSTLKGGNTDASWTRSGGSAIIVKDSVISVYDSVLANGRIADSTCIGEAVIEADLVSEITLKDVTLDAVKTSYSSDIIDTYSDSGDSDGQPDVEVNMSGIIFVPNNKLSGVVIVVPEGESVSFRGNVDASYIADTITVKYVKKDVDDKNKDNDEEADLYDIVLEGDAQFINRLTTADLTFALTSATAVKPVYEILPVKPVTITTDADYENRYMFNFDGVTQPDETAKEIVIGQVKISGYGAYEFGVATADTNLVNATKTNDSIVENFIPGGAAGKGVLVIDATINDEIVVPTRDLTINLDFPNAVEKNAVDYQQMKVTVSGGDLAEAIVIELGDTDTTTAVATEYEKKDAKYVIDVEDGYTVTVTDVLTVNTAYTVTVEGEGYRTYRYTVTMTGDKTLNFWNNVKDNAVNVEEKKDSSAKNVTFLAGDIVKDAIINIYDLSAVVSYFGEIDLDENNNKTYAKYDLNRDGKIDSKDVAYVLVSWGK